MKRIFFSYPENCSHVFCCFQRNLLLFEKIRSKTPRRLPVPDAMQQHQGSEGVSSAKVLQTEEEAKQVNFSLLRASYSRSPSWSPLWRSLGSSPVDTKAQTLYHHHQPLHIPSAGHPASGPRVLEGSSYSRSPSWSAGSAARGPSPSVSGRAPTADNSFFPLFSSSDPGARAGSQSSAQSGAPPIQVETRVPPVQAPTLHDICVKTVLDTHQARRKGNPASHDMRQARSGSEREEGGGPGGGGGDGGGRRGISPSVTHPYIAMRREGDATKEVERNMTFFPLFSNNSTPKAVVKGNCQSPLCSRFIRLLY